MVTFAQAQERADEWINADLPAYQHREVRVREFDLGFVVWAEDREGGPVSDGGRQRLVIARDSGDTTLWPGLPVGEVIRRYEEEYGRAGQAAEPPAPPRGNDLEQTSFLLSPPEWLQEAADKLGIPDHRAEASAGTGTGTGTGAGAPAAPPAPQPPAEPAPPGGTSGGGTPWPAAAQVDGAAAEATPWAGTDTSEADDDRAVPAPATVFAPPLSGDDDERTPPPGVSPEAKTALISGGSALPNTAVVPAQDIPAAPSAGAASAPAAPPAPEPGRPVPPGAEDLADAATSKAQAAPRGPRNTGATPPPPPGPPGVPGAQGGASRRAAARPTCRRKLASQLPGVGRLPAPPRPRHPAAPGPARRPGHPGHACGRRSTTRRHAGRSQPGPGRQRPAAPGPARYARRPRHPPPPPGARARLRAVSTTRRPCWPVPTRARAATFPQAPGPPGAPGTPPPAAPGTPPGGVHHAATMLAGPGPNPSQGAGVPQPPGPPGPPPQAPGAAYGYPQQPVGLPTVGPGYQAVLRYRAQDGSEQQLIRRSAPGTPHPEWQMLHELRAMGVPPQQVLELHTELESCELPGAYCARMIRETFPQARITSIAPYGRDHASRQEGMRQLLEHQGELHQVADGPARPAPVRAPLPPVPPAPQVGPDVIAQELAGALGPQGVFRFDQHAVSRQGVPDVVAHTLVWAGLPLDLGPFFWAQAQPGRPVPTLAELAQERGVQPASDAGSYLVMGSDFGKALCVQYGTAHIVAVPVEAGPGGAPVPPQFVNTGLPEFVRCLALLARMWRLRFGLNQEQAGRWTVDFQAQLAALDPAALGSPENWWSVVLEQMWDGLF
ncbi:SUKH-4 family immunity protein [Streptomyces koyangensis]|uniref:SUKH-4 family immunity protein n=1 Tax=Streptomyces koyangensis TaxID=188770 RepID=UPI001CED5C99|nr:SUKH-4 family immunity protein [Streptomyces koyangensis]